MSVLVGAGDVAVCGSAGTKATGALLSRQSGTVFAAGDLAYPSGKTEDFQNCYDPAWGRHKARTRPSPGNHDFFTANGRPYFDYFGERAGPSRLGYYNFKVSITCS